MSCGMRGVPDEPDCWASAVSQTQQTDRHLPGLRTADAAGTPACMTDPLLPLVSLVHAQVLYLTYLPK